MSIFSRKTRRASKVSTLRPRGRLHLESLEDRSVPTAGMLDPTFGSGGFVKTPNPGYATNLAISPLEGDLLIQERFNSVVSRYDVMGTLEGVLPVAHIVAMTVDDLGRTIVVGPSNQEAAYDRYEQDFGVWRFNANGTPDMTFNGTGMVVTPFPPIPKYNGGSFVGYRPSDDIPVGVAIDSSGRIVVVGSVDNPNDNSAGTRALGLARYNDNGTPDLTFGTDGIKIVDSIDIPWTEPADIFFDSSDRIVMKFASYSGEIYRFSGNGSLDPSFGVGGTVSFGEVLVRRMILDHQDRIVVGGSGSWGNSGYGDFALARYNTDGGLDLTFGDGGKVFTDFGSDDDGLWGLAVDRYDRIVATGGTYHGDYDYDIALARYNYNGDLDTTFGIGGRVITDLTEDDYAYTVAVDAMGHLVVGGQYRPDPNIYEDNAIILRYVGDTDTDDDGIADSVDTQPTVFSNDFSDGTTTGTISKRGDQTISIVDAPNAANGLLITADFLGGPTPAIIRGVNGAAKFFLNAGDQLTLTQGSVILNVLAGTVEAEFVADSGQVATASLTAGTELTFEPDTFTFIAPATNTQAVHVFIDGTEVSVSPGESVHPLPVAVDDTVETTEDAAVSIAVLANDSPGVGSLTISGFTQLSHGTVMLNDDGTITYTPAATCDSGASDSFTYTITDGTGAQVTATVTIAITQAVQDGATTIDSYGVVRIGSTADNDSIVMTVGGGHLLRNGVDTGISAGNITELRVWARAGNDMVDLSALSIKAFVRGGDGHDSLTGGGADDVLIGGDGDDILIGGAGHDFLIGGIGSDRLVGSAGNDILAAGDIDCVLNLAALRSISSAWAQSHIVTDDTVDNVLDETMGDNSSDQLTGGSGADLFIINSGDRITDFKFGSATTNKDGDAVIKDGVLAS